RHGSERQRRFVPADHFDELGNEALGQTVVGAQRLQLAPFVTAQPRALQRRQNPGRRQVESALDLVGDGRKAAEDELLTLVERVVEIEDSRSHDAFRTLPMTDWR